MRWADESESAIAADLELGMDSRALREGVDLAVEDLAERSADDALRLERVRDLPELAVELDEAAAEVVEAAVRLLAVVLEDERIDLLLEELDVGGEREDVLDRPVVEVEAEAHEAALGRRDERTLAARRVLEEALALDHGTERGCRLAEVGVRNALLDRSETADDGRVRLSEAQDGSGAELRAAEQREA